MTGVDIQHQAPAAPAPQGVLPAFWGKVTAVAGETGNITGDIGSWIGTQFTNAAKDVIGTGAGAGHAIVDKMNVDSLNAQTQELSTRLDNIVQSYKSGQLSKQDYLKALDQYNQDNTNVSNQLSNWQSKISGEQQNFTKSVIGTEVTIASLMTGGLGAGLSSPELIAGNTAAASLLSGSSELAAGAQVIEHLATSEAGWGAVSPLAQQAMRIATQQALEAAGASATAVQISRAAAADLLLKFPLYYNAMSGTGSQVYTELNQNKYGDAVKTIAFNAALLFSGGPIGWGLKQVKGIASDATIAMGLRPGSMLDELSSRIDGRDRLALGKIAQEQLRAGNKAEVKAMIVGLDSTLKRAGGNAALGVNMITDHLSNYIGWGDLKGMSHQQVWDNMISYWQHATGLQDLKAAGKIEGMAASDGRVVVPGRFSTADKNGIATAVTKGDLALTTHETVPTSTTAPQTVEGRLKAWENYKAANPNAAFANNVNVDKQITNFIKTTEDPSALHTAINSIPTQVGLDGIPSDYASKMAKDGYIAIVPTSHNLPVVPFSETSGKLATNAAGGAGFFTKAAQPVPVLKSVGAFLTWAGMSPVAAGQRVQDIFTQKFTEAASQFGFLHLFGDTASQTGQDTLAKLSDYMKAPTGGMHIGSHVLPITDMRQLSTNDIVRALGVSKSDAKTVGDAIMQAYLDVPREVTGLGNKVMDVNFKVNPLAAPLSRIQGAMRFSWNPVFTQARLPLKAEFLAQMQTGGKFPTIAGTNRFMSMFFPGQYKELNAVIDNPDFISLIGHGLGGEADAALTGVKNIASEMPPRTTLLPVAGLVRDMANNAGLDTATYIKQFPRQVQDATQALLHYDRNASFLNSPMAKTLNVAFFPFRFNVKVTTFMAKALAEQVPAVQYAAVKGIMNAQTFLKSPQGQAWYSQNSDVIGLFKYFSPLETLSSISSILTHPGTISAYGELGGLPFGWIPQATDAAGLTHFGQAYVNPKTGAIAKDYVPTSMYGAANAAVQDLLGSLFTYPGATAGLPSKGSVERRIVGGMLPGSSKDFNPVNAPNITAQDKQFSQIVQQTNGGTAPSQQGQPTTPTSQTSTSTTVPTQKSPLETVTPKSTKGAKLKKSQFKPYLLPGQSQLGQL